MSENDKLAAQAARKRLLIAQGEMYRVGIVHARANVGYALRPESLLQGVVETAVGFAGHRVESLLAPGGMRLQGTIVYRTQEAGQAGPGPRGRGRRCRQLAAPQALTLPIPGTPSLTAFFLPVR
jgi:hypothetical protein